MDRATEWTAISGSWRASTPGLTRDLRVAVAAELRDGRGIIAGGALGVDFDATEQVLRLHPDGDRTLVIIPTSLETYAAHYKRRAQEGIITHEQHHLLISQLRHAETLGCLVEMNFTLVNKDSYYARNSEVLRPASRLLAFQVNASTGTQDTIDKAKAAGLDVRVFAYQA
jgi:hypothetical protein